jgi:hypothetical protein
LPIVLPQLQGEAEVAPTTGTDTARRTDYLELLSQLMRGTAPATLLPHLAAIVAALTGSSNSSSSSSSSNTASALPAITAAPADAVTSATDLDTSTAIASAAAEGTQAAVTQTAVSLAAVTLGDSDSPAVRAATLTALHSLLATVCRAGSSSSSTSTTTSTTAAAAAAAGSAARAAVQAHFLKTGRLATLDVLSRGAVAYALACRALLTPAADSVLQLLAVLGGWPTVGALVSAHGCALVASCLAAWPSVAAWTLGSQQQAVLQHVLLGFEEGKAQCASQLPGIVAIVEVRHCHIVHYVSYCIHAVV